MLRLLAALGVVIASTVVVFSLGWSPSQSEPVSQALFERLPASVELLVAALITAVAFGGITGFARARARLPAARGVVAAAVLVCRAIPIVIALMLVQVALIFTPLLSQQRLGSPDLRERIAYIIAPVLVLAVPFGAWASVIFYDRFRASSEGRISRRDILTTIATTSALIGPPLASAMVLVEPSFAWPGLARAFSNALQQFDVRLVAGFVVLYLCGILVIQLCAGAARTEDRSPSDRRGRISPAGVAACATLLAAILGAVLAPWIAPVGPNSIDLGHWVGYPLAPGTAGHPLGTDENGRDLLARLLFGLRTSLGIAAAATAIATALAALAAKTLRSVRWIGTEPALGLTAIRPFTGLPLILVAVMAIVATTRSRDVPNLLTVALMIGAVSWPAGIAAFRVSGTRRLSGIIGLAGGALLLETTMSAIGFGAQPPIPSLGNMLVNAMSNLAVAPAAAIVPSVTTIVVLGAFYALADALREMPGRADGASG